MGNESEERNEFSDETVEKAWEDAEKKCEKCGKELKWKNRGRDKDDFWEAHHKDGNPKNDKLENCQILCWPCHEKTLKKKTGKEVIDETL
jgi:hypothetical protein